MQLLILSPTTWSVPDDIFVSAGFNVIRRVMPAGGRPEWQAVSAADALIMALYTPEECIELTTRLRKQEPGAVIVPVCPQPDPEFLLRMMRLGVREILTGDDAGTISDLLDTLAVGGGGTRTEASRRSLCLGFAGAKGGDGTTMTLANFAWELSRLPDVKVVVVDVAQPFGDVEIYLTDKRPTHDLASFSEEIGRLDDSLFNTMIGHVSDQLDLIAAPATFDRAMTIAPEHVGHIVDRLVNTYDFVLIDLGSLIAPISLPLLDKLDKLLMVCRATVASARAASQQLHLLESLEFPMTEASLVINASGSGDGISRFELAKATNKTVDLVLPEVGKMANTALAAGVPVVGLAPRSLYARVIRNWVSELTGLSIKEQSLWNRLRNK